MKNFFFALVTCAVITLCTSVSFSNCAYAAKQNDPCQKEEIGKTVMDDDDQNIIACLKTGQSNPPQIWKSMTPSDNEPKFGGMYFTNYNYSCDGQSDGTPVVCRYKNPLTGSCSCPSGYKTKKIYDFNKCTAPTYWYYSGEGLGPSLVAGSLVYYCYKEK